MPALSLQSALIWVTCPALQIACVYFLHRRKMLEQFKLLASFFVFMTLKAGVLFLCYRYAGPSSWTYFATYWVLVALTDLFIIAVLYEIFCAAFKPFAGLQDLAKVVFKWAAGCVLFMGFIVFTTAPATPMVKVRWIMVGVNSFERSVLVLQCALLLFLYMGSQHLGVSKRNRVFGFALGFGLQAFCQLLVLSAAANSHVSKTPMWGQLIPIVYSVSLVIWLAYLAQPEPARESLHIAVTSPLLRWNEVALALGHSGGQVAVNLSAEPFMPSVERMVEKVMQKELILERRQQRVV